MKQYKTLLTLISVTLVYMAKMCMFDVACLADAYEHSTWLMVASLSAKMAVSLALASLTVASTKRWPTIVVMLLLDAWILTNIIYFRVNLLFLNWGIIKMATNLSGFEGAILPYLSLKLLAVPMTTLIGWGIMCIVSSLVKPNTKSDVSCGSRRWIGFGATWVGILLCYMLSVWGRTGYVKEKYDREFSTDICSVLTLPKVMQQHVSAIHLEIPQYIKLHSIGMYFVRECYRALTYEARLSRVSLTPEEHRLVEERMQMNGEGKQTVEQQNPVQGHLLVVLLESFEGWVLDAKDVYGEYVCHRLNGWMQRHPTLVSKRMVSERIYGESGDGQLITLTGLLPLQEGVACNEFATNVYPNYAHFYEDAVVINSSRGVWNKDVAMPSYGFRRIIQSTDPKTAFLGNDDVIFGYAIRELENAKVPTCVLPLSVSMHLPFNYNTLPVELDESLSPMAKDYLRSARFTDEHLGVLLEWTETAPQMENATIVITADHSILSPNQDPAHDHRYIPLIVMSPCIDENIEIEEETYQMDVFPTVLHAIGQENYYWKGLGTDLIQQPITRTLSEEKAYMLSDKLIRMNYFAK